MIEPKPICDHERVVLLGRALCRAMGWLDGHDFKDDPEFRADLKLMNDAVEAAFGSRLPISSERQ